MRIIASPYLNTLSIVLVSFGLLLGNLVNGQSNPHPCQTPNVICNSSGANGVVTSFGNSIKEYAAPGRSMPFWIAAGDTVTGIIDTSVSAAITLSKISGPGNLTGTLSQVFSKYAYFNDFKFSAVGVYEVEVSMAGYQKDTIEFNVIADFDFCSVSPGGTCVGVGGNELYGYPMGGQIIPVDAVFPVMVGIRNSVTGKIDSTFFSRIYTELVSGPGNMYGTFSMHGTKWLLFNDIHFDQIGDYQIRFTSDGFIPDTVDVTVVGLSHSISENQSQPLEIFPNPFTNEFNVELPVDLKKGNLKIIDLTGKTVFELAVNESSESTLQLDVQALKSGIYFVEINNQETNHKERGIVVKK